MALSNSRKKRGNLTIDELFKRPPQQQKKSSNEDEDLQLAMEMSQREHINEQKRLFEQYSLLSQRQFKPSTPSSATTTTMHTKNKRVIKMDPEEEEEEEERIENFTDDDDDDQWFQTVSIRPQQPPVKKTPSKPKSKPKLKQKEASKQKSKRHIPPPPTSTSATASTFSMHNDTSNNNNTPIVKREDGDEILLDIDDLDEWLDAKTEKPEASDPALEITDLDAYLDSYQDEDEDMEQEPRSVITIDDQDDIPPPRHIPCPMCQKLFKPGREVQEHAAKCNNMISDTDSDCDIIDLINPANTVISKQTSSPPPSFAEAPVAQEEDEDDGYLSPLEGFTSIKNNQSEAFNPYFQQLQQPAPKPRKARTTRKSTTTTKRGGGRGRFRPYRRKKKS